MDQGQNQGQDTTQPAQNVPPQTSGAAPSLEPQPAAQPQDTVVGKTDATTYEMGSQSGETSAQKPADHESVADKLFAPFKKLMNAGKAPQNVAPEKPEPLTEDQPHVATPTSEPQPQS